MAVAAAVVAAVGEVHIKPRESPDATVTSLREGEGQGRAGQGPRDAPATRTHSRRGLPQPQVPNHLLLSAIFISSLPILSAGSNIH